MITKTNDNAYSEEHALFVEKEKAAVNLLSHVGNLLYNKSVELVLFRNPLFNEKVSEVLRLHNYAKDVVSKPVDIFETAAIAEVLTGMNVAPSKIDIGRLAFEWAAEKGNYADKESFLNDKLNGFLGEGDSLKPKDVILYGFGRIGRLVTRELIKQAGKGQQLRLRAIVTRKVTELEIEKRAALLRNDSVHGSFPGTVEVDLENRALVLNGQRVQFIESPTPEQAEYTKYGIKDALLIDSTGVFTDREALGRHLQADGVSKVLLTAPGKEIPNIVYAVNSKEIDIENENIFSAASCTTNAISPVLRVMEDQFGVVKGHIETVHAYTNDQNLLDNMHKKPRRGRSAAINMVITSTGAGKAVTKVMPSFQNKLTANAVRVPTPNGSLAILSLEVAKEATVESVNETLRKAALEGDLVNQIFFSTDPELVSNDIIGNTCCSVFDSLATIASQDKKNVVLYVWYDNEFGYTKQVIRLAKHIAKVRRLLYY